MNALPAVLALGIVVWPTTPKQRAHPWWTVFLAYIAYVVAIGHPIPLVMWFDYGPDEPRMMATWIAAAFALPLITVPIRAVRTRLVPVAHPKDALIGNALGAMLESTGIVAPALIMVKMPEVLTAAAGFVGVAGLVSGALGAVFVRRRAALDARLS